MTPIDTLVNFVIDKISPLEFEAALSKNEALVEFLSDNDPLLPYADRGGLFVYLISRNFQHPDDLLNAKDVVTRFLKTKDIEATIPREDFAAVELKLSILPKWLEISDDYFQKLVDASPYKSSKPREKWLKQELTRRFRYLNRPPRWLQSAEWPNCRGEPLTFIGQLDISAIKHDSAAAYVFLNEQSGDYLVLEQST
jgi:hypothetical protein